MTIEGEGTVEEKVITNPSGREYPYGTTVELNPIPKEGWEFESWGGDLNGNDTPKRVLVDKEMNISIKFSKFFLHENGVTCRCPTTVPGEIGVINGVEYQSVDNNLLFQKRDQGADMTKLCTSLVTNMKELFYKSDFNQPIGHWDVSNVLNMDLLFTESQFNQPIGDWDVSNVDNAGSMFWDSPFNRPISNWDVSKVTNMSFMFYRTTFNQPIGDWDVSKVTTMTEMFRNSPFNQPIGNWNVSNVVEMFMMFSGSQFNQNISSWCVSKIKSEPGEFARNSPLTEENMPVWGSCPNHDR